MYVKKQQIKATFDVTKSVCELVPNGDWDNYFFTNTKIQIMTRTSDRHTIRLTLTKGTK